MSQQRLTFSISMQGLRRHMFLLGHVAEPDRLLGLPDDGGHRPHPLCRTHRRPPLPSLYITQVVFWRQIGQEKS